MTINYNKTKIIPWGPIGYITFKRTYARRLKENDLNSKTEEFHDVVIREINAAEKQLKINFTNEEKLEYYNLRTDLKFSVAGRFMWQLGTKTVEKIGLPSLQNCAFVTVNSPIEPFVWAFEMLMLGSGVGYNIQKENVYQLPKLKNKVKIERLDEPDADFIVPDTREGWVKLLGKVLKSHFYSGEGFTYSTICIRGKGALIKGFGGLASGPEELCWGISEIHKILNNRSNKKLRPIDCLDIMNIIGFIVVSGNVRRSAQIAIGDYDDIDFLKAKRWDLGQIPNWRSMSNNSIVTPEDFSKIPEEFWETYNQGEPYGLINIDLSRKVGRIGETQYIDPNIEGYNPCQPKWAKVLTKDGIKEFKDIDINSEIWSKEGWTKVIKKWSTGINKVYKYSTTAGVFYGTENHRLVSNNNKLEAENCDSIDIFTGPEINNTILNEQDIIDGLVIGDGYAHKASNNLIVLGIGKDDENYFDSEIKNYILKYRPGIADTAYEIKTTIKPEELPLLPIRIIPERFLNKDKICGFLRGLYSANGSVCDNRITLKSSCLELVEQVQLMLSSIGIQSYYTTNKPKNVKFSNGEYLCKQSYDLNITSDREKFVKNIGFIQQYKNDKIKIKTHSFRKSTFDIISKEFISEEETFDITVDNNSHTYWTQGCNVSNCAEQSLENWETCCLADLFLPNIQSYEELLKCIKYAYIMNKHSLAIKCHLKKTEEIVHKNMRMGIGITGYLQASEEQRSWLKDAYVWLRNFDKEYSKDNNFPTSIKLTTCKPSGTLSLLPGVTPGVHPNPAGPYYIRRIRISSNSPLIKVCMDNGYHMEFQKNFDNSDDKTTMVVEFPCMVPETTPVASNFTWKEQIENVVRLQKEWSDNSVSCTVYYKKEDIEDIKEYLKENMPNNIKSISFLLQSDHGFKQAPYETISKERYEELIKLVKPINSIGNISDEFEVEECSSGMCPVK